MEQQDWIEMASNMQELRLFSRTVIQRTAKSNKLTSQQLDLLSQLVIHDSVTPLHLAKLMGVSKTIISRIVDKLYHEEFITKNSDEKDKRSYTISITKKGLAEIDKIYKEYLGPIYKLRTKLGTKDFMRLMNLIIDANQKMSEVL